jgi:methylmalonyl-CoA mutase
MSNDNKLFTEFPAVTAEQWIQQAIRDLKGSDFTEKLQYTTADGITVQPFYTEADLAGRPAPEPLFTHTDWEICETIPSEDVEAANKKALHALNNGATALRFRIAEGTKPEQLLRDISPEHIDLQFDLPAATDAFARKFQAWIRQQGLRQDQLRVAFNADFLARLLLSGKGQKTVGAEGDAWVNLFNETTPFRSLCIDAVGYQNAGAPPAFQLACALAQAREYLDLPGVRPEDLAGRIQINIAVGPDYFFEIAKLRALRKVFALLLGTYGGETQVYVHAETAFRNLTVYDPYNNLLRTTTEAMAAVIGGCNSLTVLPFDAALRPANDFSGRMARNIQLILKAESYFDKVADISAGSYFVETLTEQIAEKAWTWFREIEAAGGFIASLEKGSIQATIRDFAQTQAQRFEEGKEILVGINKYPNAQETLKENFPITDRYSTPDAGAEIEPLDTTRLAAAQEQARMKAEK